MVCSYCCLSISKGLWNQRFFHQPHFTKSPTSLLGLKGIFGYLSHHFHLFQGRKLESSPLMLYNYFIERVRKNLHIALTMSPIGDAFRNRLRMFPSIINCCTIDWFQVEQLARLEHNKNVVVVKISTEI